MSKTLDELRQEKLALLEAIRALLEESAQEEAAYVRRRTKLLKKIHGAEETKGEALDLWLGAKDTMRDLRLSLAKENDAQEAKRHQRAAKLAALQLQMATLRPQFVEASAQEEAEKGELLALLESQRDTLAPLLQQSEAGQVLLSKMAEHSAKRAQKAKLAPLA